MISYIIIIGNMYPMWIISGIKKSIRRNQMHFVFMPAPLGLQQQIQAHLIVGLEARLFCLLAPFNVLSSATNTLGLRNSIRAHLSTCTKGCTREKMCTLFLILHRTVLWPWPGHMGPHCHGDVATWAHVVSTMSWCHRCYMANITLTTQAHRPTLSL